MTIISHSGTLHSLELHVEYFFKLIENYSITVPWNDIHLPKDLLVIVFAYHVNEVVNQILHQVNWNIQVIPKELQEYLIDKIAPFVTVLVCRNPKVISATLLETTKIFSNTLEFILKHDSDELNYTIVDLLCTSMEHLSVLDISRCRRLSFNSCYSTIKKRLSKDTSLKILFCRAFYKYPENGYKSIIINLNHVIKSFKNVYPNLKIKFIDVQESEIIV